MPPSIHNHVELELMVKRFKDKTFRNFVIGEVKFSILGPLYLESPSPTFIHQYYNEEDLQIQVLLLNMIEYQHLKKNQLYFWHKYNDHFTMNAKP